MLHRWRGGRSQLWLPLLARLPPEALGQCLALRLREQRQCRDIEEIADALNALRITFHLRGNPIEEGIVWIGSRLRGRWLRLLDGR